MSGRGMSARLAATLMLCAAAPAMAQAPPAPANAPDAARIAAAKRLVNAVLPPSKRDDIMRAMIAPTIANVRASFQQNPQFAKLLANDPRAGALMQTFIERQIGASMQTTIAALPALVDAMALAYARRFTTAQLDEMAAFYATPTGTAFVDQMPTIMADPDIERVQREMMTAAMSRVTTDAQAFAEQLAALEKTTPKGGQKP